MTNTANGSQNTCHLAGGGTPNGNNHFDESSLCPFNVTDLQTTSAHLGVIQNNDGLTLTMAPAASSAAINGGSRTLCSTAPVNNIDQTGKPRVTTGF